MPEVTWQISGATILVVLGWIVTGGFQTFKIGRALERTLANLEQLRREVDALKAGETSVRQVTEAHNAAHAGAIALQKDQFAELRQTIADRYARKDELDAVERRVTASQDRIFDRLGEISEGLEHLRRDLIKAVRAPA